MEPKDIGEKLRELYESRKNINIAIGQLTKLMSL